MRKPLLPAVLTVLAALGPETLLAQATTGPSLTVVLSLDGLSWSRLEHYRPWYVGGLKRLLEEGQVETGARYRHLNTETSPGHAALATGAPPRVTGVVANRWIEQNHDGSMRSVGAAQPWATDVVPGQPPLFYRAVEKDGRLHVFALARELELWERSGETGRAIVRLGEGPSGETVVFDSEDAITLFNLRHGRPEERFRPTTTATGPGNLRVPTLGDRLVEASPQSRVVAVSGKDRTTVFLAGRDRRHVAYWFDQETGRFVTSAAYDAFGTTGAAGRALVSRFNAQRAGSQLPVRFGTLWERLPAPVTRVGFGDPALPAPASGLWDFQLPTNGLGFPHDLRLSERGYFYGVYTSPLADEITADLAVDFIADEAFRLGRSGAPDLLAIGFSAQDVVSHSYGNESEENLDTIRRLDLQVGRVFDALDRSLPRGSYVVAMSADHGFALIPEAEKSRNPSFTGGRLVNTERTMPTVYERLNRYLTQQLCLPPGSRPVFGGEGWNVAYNRPAFPMRTVEGPCGAADRPVTLPDLDRAFPKAVAALYSEEVETVLLVSERDRWPADLPATEFARNDFDAERSGDAFLVPRPGVLMHWDPARGSHHGSHHEYDTHVPLVFWGKPFPPGRKDRDTTPYDLAPTLAELLGVTLPDATGKSLLVR
ncbi:MAG TPA: alkaline phosphatase family protein [Vicinamibacteria bacterium]|nr:alkaline phosphatase family protein [Vicinamibacteria bacterium]